MQLIFVYVVGGYLKRFVDIDNNKRWVFFCIYIGCCLLWTISTIFQSIRFPFSYNHPFIFLSAIGFFLFAMTFHFKSRTVNWLSSSALAVYLIQSAPVAVTFLYPKTELLSDTYGGVRFLIFAALAFTITIACCLFDKIRIVIMKPVWTIYGKIEAKINNVQERVVKSK